MDIINFQEQEQNLLTFKGKNRNIDYISRPKRIFLSKL